MRSSSYGLLCMPAAAKVYCSLILRFSEFWFFCNACVLACMRRSCLECAKLGTDYDLCLHCCSEVRNENRKVTIASFCPWEVLTGIAAQ